MNYLAHLYLSFPDPERMTGNFIADSVKGDHFNNYPDGIRAGILMHRAIDDFTDHHPVVLESKKVFTSQFDKYSGVLIDVWFDHLLALHFDKYSSVPLSHFATDTYEILRPYSHLFPEHASRFFYYMTQENVLLRYADLAGIEQVLKGITYRIKNRMILNESIPLFVANEELLYRNFVVFFDDLRKRVLQV
jgi:acyl carrier protein phosphodiesterase